MINSAIKQKLKKINDLIATTRTNTNENLELQAHWAKYICVLSAGFLEFALAQLYSDYTKTGASSPVHNHVSQYLSKIQNPKSTKFVEIAKSFKVEWGEALQAFVDEQGRSEAIGNIMNNRHLIAHGRDSQITLSKISDYLKKSVEVLEYIEKQCDLKHDVTVVR